MSKVSKNSIYIVAGGANGIGASIASKLFDEGADVLVLDKVEPNKKIEGVEYIIVDLSNASSVSDISGRLPENIDGLILSIGVMRRGTIMESSETDYDLLMNSNVKATWLTIKAISPKIRNDGTIVQLSSGHVLDPEADPGIYTLSKKAVTALAEILELTRPELSVKYVYPGPINTQLLREGRTKEEQERVISISQDPSFIAEKTIQLIDSDHKTLKFKPKKWDYDFE